ncbi:hypothetical protein ACQSSU_03150 [Micromonospora echinospora]
MDFLAVAADLSAALKAIEGLNVPEWGEQRVRPPFAIIPLPDRIDYDATYGRGSDQIPEWSVLVLVANPTDPSARRAIAAYAAGSGSKSVKQAIEAHTYIACDEPRVTSAEFEVVSYDGVKFLAAIFTVDITGKGA